MAIPIGTTSRQLSWMARWMLAALIIAGMLTWWWPAYRSWGALSAGLLVVFWLWLLWRTVAADRTVPGHPFYLVLLAPAVILAVHAIRPALMPRVINASRGPLPISLLFQLVLLALGVLLTQCLLPLAARHIVVLGLCGAAIMGGSAAAVLWGSTHEVRDAMTLLGLAGVGVWLSPLWGQISPDGTFRPADPLRRFDLRLACTGVAVLVAAGFLRIAPRSAIRAGCVVGTTLLLGGLIYRRWRRASLLTGGVLAIGSFSIAARVPWRFGPTTGAGWFGKGEEAFGELSATDSGLAVLVGMIGWVGAAWLAGGMGLCVLTLLWRARRGTGYDQGRALVWAAATALVSVALLTVGGLFVPAVTLGAGLMWGMFPAMLGRPTRRRSGATLLAAILLFTVLLGFSRTSGLVVWSAAAFGLKDKFLHGVIGFFFAGMLAWLTGARRVWLGLAGIALAAATGGVGEMMQWGLGSGRSAEFADWIAHALGSAAAILPYLLCMGARACESPDVLAAGDSSA